MKKSTKLIEIFPNYYKFTSSEEKNFCIIIDGNEEEETFEFYLYDMIKGEKVAFMFGLMKKDIEKCPCKNEAALQHLADSNFKTYLKQYKKEIETNNMINKTIYATGRIPEYDEKIGNYAFCILKKEPNKNWEIIKRNNNPIIFRTEQDAIDGTQAAAEMKL